MTSVLQIDSSARHQGSVTRELTAAIVGRLRGAHSDVTVSYRDLTAEPLPHISPEFLGGIFGAPNLADHETVRRSDVLIAELFAAEAVVIGAPMYNFAIPSQLKAWVDHILRAGKTFRYSDEGRPIGLVTGRRAIVAVASGGIYTEGPMIPYDHVGTLMTQLLGFIGFTDIAIVRAEAQAMGDAAAASARTQAASTIAGLAA